MFVKLRNSFQSKINFVEKIIATNISISMRDMKQNTILILI